MKNLFVISTIVSLGFLVSCGGSTTCDPKNCETNCPENQVPCPKNPGVCYDTTVDYVVDPCACVLDSCSGKEK